MMGLFKNPMIGGYSKTFRCKARKNRTAWRIRYTLSGAVCSATQQMSVFQQISCGLFIRLCHSNQDTLIIVLKPDVLSVINRDKAKKEVFYAGNYQYSCQGNT
jgi:hypothetical protein